MTRFPILRTLLALLLAWDAHAATVALTTTAERSGFRTTGRYDEVVALCAAFQKAYPKAVRCVEFGRTPEGRPMLALVASRSGALSAEAARRRNIPVLLIQGGIHAGEIDGKDAGFLALRELLEGHAAAGALQRQVLVFVPVFNVDGHERFGRWNRPEPARSRGNGLARPPRRTSTSTATTRRPTRRRCRRCCASSVQWDPLACIDLHVTDGAKFEHDVAIQVEPVHAGDPELRRARAARCATR